MRRYAWTFAVGGTFGLCGQLLVWLWEAVLGGGNPLATPLAMAALGIIGFFLCVSGASDKLTSLTTMGVAVPTSGFVIAVGTATQAEINRMDGDVAAALRKVAAIPLLVLGGGGAFAIGICVGVAAVTGNPPMAASAELEVPPLVSVFLSFVVGGLVAALAEAVMEMTSKPVPLLMLAFIVVGAILALIGIDATPLGANGGYSVSILAAGQGVLRTFALLIAGATPTMFVAVVAVFCFVSLLGLSAGVVRFKLVEE